MERGRERAVSLVHGFMCHLNSVELHRPNMLSHLIEKQNSPKLRNKREKPKPYTAFHPHPHFLREETVKDRR